MPNACDANQFRTLFTRVSDLAPSDSLVHPETVLVMPYVDEAMAARAAGILARRARRGGLLVCVEDDKRLGFVRVANQAYLASNSDYFGYLAQDVYPGEHWLDQAVKTLEGSKAGLLAFNDGRFFGTLAVFGLARRSWLAELYGGLLFHPGYASHFADTELTAIAYAQNQLVFNPNSLLIEVDWEKHKKGNNPEDDAFYKKRLAHDFDGLARQQD